MTDWKDAEGNADYDAHAAEAEGLRHAAEHRELSLDIIEFETGRRDYPMPPWVGYMASWILNRGWKK